jgi:hypothetical protein
MSSDFNLKDIRQKFNLKITEKLGIFSNTAESTITEHFKETLKDNISLGLFD